MNLAPLTLVLVFVGAGVGGVGRYLLTSLIQGAPPDGPEPWFPSGTLVVNVLGCALLGFLAAALTGPIQIREEYKIGLLVGVLGGFTTFSTFGRDTFELASSAEMVRAGLNVVLSVGLGILAVWGGAVLSGRVFSSAG